MFSSSSAGPFLVSLLVLLLALVAVLPQPTNAWDAPTSAPEGPVHDAECSVETVMMLQQRVAPLVGELVEKAFFKYYKVNLWRPCEFWPDDGQCNLRTCAVEECDKQEFDDIFCDEEGVVEVENELALINPETNPEEFNAWKELRNPWTIDSEEADAVDHQYVDLSKNSERFTGYKGEGALRIWRAIYTENCFNEDPKREECVEKRLFFRLISGMHASITAHVAYDFLLDEVNEQWGRNIDLFMRGVGYFPDRLQNLYLTYLVCLKAVTKLSPYLEKYPYNTKFAEEGAEISKIFGEISAITHSCGDTFDETALFSGSGRLQMLQDTKLHFKNVSKILDCVICEKCKMWAKIRMNGLGAAMKILFELSKDDIIKASPEQPKSTAKVKVGGEVEEETEKEEEGGVNEKEEVEKVVVVSDNLKLQRSEIVALMHMLVKLSDSIQMSEEMFNTFLEEQRQYQQSEKEKADEKSGL